MPALALSHRHGKRFRAPVGMWNIRPGSLAGTQGSHRASALAVYRPGANGSLMPVTSPRAIGLRPTRTWRYSDQRRLSYFARTRQNRFRPAEALRSAQRQTIRTGIGRRVRGIGALVLVVWES